MLQRGDVCCALSSILILILSGCRAGDAGGGQATGRATDSGRHATLRLGVRRGYVDAEVDAITAASKLSPGVKYPVNSSSEMAVGSHIVVGARAGFRLGHKLSRNNEQSNFPRLLE